MNEDSKLFYDDQQAFPLGVPTVDFYCDQVCWFAQSLFVEKGIDAAISFLIQSIGAAKTAEIRFREDERLAQTASKNRELVSIVLETYRDLKKERAAPAPVKAQQPDSNQPNHTQLFILRLCER